jgi:ribosomal-protein-serine acetyltransferase
VFNIYGKSLSTTPSPALIEETDAVLALPKSEAVDLRLLEDSDAEELQSLIVANREHLAAWLPWAAGQGLADSRAFIVGSHQRIAADEGLEAAVAVEGAIVGVIGIHSIEWSHRSARLGYWLSEGSQGQGLITEAARAFLGQALRGWELHRIEIRAAPENVRSCAIAARLGFTLEGRLREAELVGDRYLDNVVYAMLADEWKRIAER